MALVVSCMASENSLLSFSVARVVGCGLFRDASEAPNRPSCCGQRAGGCVVPVGVVVQESLIIDALRVSAAFDMFRIPVSDSLSSVSAASVLNSKVADGLKLLFGPFPAIPSVPSFHMASVSVNIGVTVSDSSGSCAI